MTFINVEQFKQILAAAPPGTDPETLVKALEARGHTLPSTDTRTGLGKAVDFVGNVTGIGNPIDAFFGKQTGGVTGAVQGAVNVALEPTRSREIIGQAESSRGLIEQARKLKAGDPKRRELLNQARAVSSRASERAGMQVQKLEEAPTAKQAAGSTLKVAALAASFGGVPAAITPFSKLTAFGRIGNAASVGGVFGGAGGLASAGEAGVEDRGKLLKSALIGVGAGVVIGGVIQGTIEGIRAAAKYFPERFYNSKLKENMAQQKTATKSKLLGQDRQTVGKEALDRKISGTNEQIFNKAHDKLNAADAKLQKALDGSKGTITKKELMAYADDVIDDLAKTPGEGDATEVYKLVFGDVPKKMTLAEANQVKRALYDALGKRGFVMDVNLAVKREAQKSLSLAIKDLIEKKSSADIAGMNADVGSLFRIREAALDQATRSDRFSLGALSFWHQVTKIVNTTWGVTKGAQVMQGISNALEAHAGQTTGPIRSYVIFQTGSVIGNEIAKQNPKAEQELQYPLETLFIDAVQELSQQGMNPEQIAQRLNFTDEGQQVANITPEDVTQALNAN